MYSGDQVRGWTLHIEYPKSNPPLILMETPYPLSFQVKSFQQRSSQLSCSVMHNPKSSDSWFNSQSQSQKDPSTEKENLVDWVVKIANRVVRLSQGLLTYHLLPRKFAALFAGLSIFVCLREPLSKYLCSDRFLLPGCKAATSCKRNGSL